MKHSSEKTSADSSTFAVRNRLLYRLHLSMTYILLHSMFVPIMSSSKKMVERDSQFVLLQQKFQASTKTKILGWRCTEDDREGFICDATFYHEQNYCLDRNNSQSVLKEISASCFYHKSTIRSKFFSRCFQVKEVLTLLKLPSHIPYTSEKFTCGLVVWNLKLWNLKLF